jgi:hypothetical protein
MDTHPTSGLDWTTANQRVLVAEFARIRERLTGGDAQADRTAEQAQALEAARAELPGPAAIDVVTDLFDLSAFERDLLLLACGVEMDASIAAACARLNGSERQRNASFGLALARLADAHWSALTPARPLRRHRLIDVEPGPRLIDSVLRVDERVLHFVAGVNVIDPLLRPALIRRTASPLMAATHRALVERLVERLRADSNPQPLILLEGDDATAKAEVVAAVAQNLGIALFELNAADLPTQAAELEHWQLVWQREARLLPALLLLRIDEGAPMRAVRTFADDPTTALFIAAREPLALGRHALAFSVEKPDAEAQRTLWRQALGERAAGLNGTLDVLSGQFRLSAQAIAETAADLTTDDSAPDLWRACRRRGRARLDDLAQRIDSRAAWDDLVLPSAPLETLRQLAAHLRQRVRVYQDWGFGDRAHRGLGVSALFSGESGTGKTLAAEVVAGALNLDLYRIDLSSVVSKYIGETEKNLRRVFDAAEDSGAILLFDEADALFGKRSEVKDSHDRYANIEISYLLQRMEAYRGLAVLTTNLKNALDRAFQRRLRYVVHFPFPDSALRETIWRQAFPAQAPLGEVDFRKLARLSLPGGNIRNIALNAAFLAAESAQPIGMPHLLAAAQSESMKLERPLADTETRGWVA